MKGNVPIYKGGLSSTCEATKRFAFFDGLQPAMLAFFYF